MERLARNLADLYGEAGNEWLRRLPALLAECADRWRLQIGPPLEPLSWNYVAPVELEDGTPAVLKAGVPHPERALEIEALRCFGGRGAVRLLDADAGLSVALLERLLPGTSLNDVVDAGRDEEATSIGAGVMRALWQPVPPSHAFPSVGDWARGLGKLRGHFGGTTGPFPPALVERAEGLFAELVGSAAPVLLHGDLHHGNILAAQRDPWLTIDPKGLVGEPGYDAGNFLNNDLPPGAGWPHTAARRADQLSDELGLDRAELRGWALAQAVLSAWWTVEDHGDGHEVDLTRALALAELA